MVLERHNWNPRHGFEDEDDPIAAFTCPAESVSLAIERHGYRASGGRRWIAIVATSTIYGIALIAAFFSISHVAPAKPAPPALTVINLQPEASPPDALPETKADAKPVEAKKQPEPPHEKAVELAFVPLAPVPAATLRAVDPVPSPPKEANVAPRTIPAPPAPQPSSNAADSWEGRVLAALNKYRRYPSVSLMRRQQGVPYIRFTMDRDGKILSSRLERSSGFGDLDREAVALPRRAQPLPKPPGDRTGDTLELVVPVEFFLR